MSGEELWQLTIAGIVLGSFYGLLGTGFGLIIGITGRFHFAFATTFVIGAYIATKFVEEGVPKLLAIGLGIAASMVVGVLCELLVYRPLARRDPGAALLAVFVSSLGITLIGENAMRLIFGSESRNLAPGFDVQRVELGASAGITTLEIVIVVVSWLVVLGLWQWLRTSRQGRAIRAVRANPEMAEAIGVDSGRLYLLVFAIGSVISGLAAIFFAMRYAVTPDAGGEPTLKALVVAFVAGLGANPLRFAVAGLTIGLVESLSNLWLSASWNPVVVFGALVVYVAIVPMLPNMKSVLRLPRRSTAGGVA